MPGPFAEYVRSHYNEVRHLPAQQRMKKLAEMYRGGAKKAAGSRGKKAVKGGIMTAGSLHGAGGFGDFLGSIIPF